MRASHGRLFLVGTRSVALIVVAATIALSAATNPAVTLTIDAGSNRHPINAMIYGVAFAAQAQLVDLNAPLNRHGGNAASRYNWQANAYNRAADWYFESIGETSATAGESTDTFIDQARAAGSEPVLTVPMLDWVAKLGTNRGKRASFSIAKYGAQTGNDWQWFPDAGNGVLTSGGNVVGNDPADANLFVNTSFQQAWLQHIVGRLGGAAAGGVRYYALDNEPSLWHSTHRDVHPTGATMDEVKIRLVDYARAIKAIDQGALTLGPEEWGWSGYFYSGYDQQWGNAHGWSGSLPDRSAHGGWDYLPWLLDELRRHTLATGDRVLDIVSVHYYPQGGEFSSSTTNSMQLLRNRSTRSLWDPNYVDETWINSRVQLIPRLRNWVNTYYAAGTPIAITEYNWGAESHMSGAMAQADVLGIFGREGLDMATRWTTPDASSPVFKAMKMYRNYDGSKSTFGDVSVAASGGNPDNVAVFAAERTADGALTVMVLNKYLTGTTPVTLNLSGFQAAGTAEVWQLTSSNAITSLGSVQFSGSSLSQSLPAQSVTLFVFPKGTVTPPPPPPPPPPATVSAPSNLMATVSKTGVTLRWTDNSSNETAFYVERRVSRQSWTRIATVAANVTTHFDAVVKGAYDYRVQAFDAASGVLSSYSNEVTARVK